jgi:8-oxo-dGTP diphosphatase
MIKQHHLDELQATAQADRIDQLVVGAVICDHDKVLLLQRPADDFMGGIYELPSGKVEPGEAIDEALMREVKEETGLAVAQIASYLGHFDYTSGSGKKSRQLNFAITPETTRPVVLTEHDTYIWADLTGQPPVTDAVNNILNKFAATRLAQ